MLRFLTAGESHGPELTVILEGLPAGVPLTTSDVNADLVRRQKSEGSGGRMVIEQDRVRITGGLMAGHTTGAPIAMTIQNKDFQSWRNRHIRPMTIPRPGHADLPAAIKYGYQDLRLGLERSSARETAARVAMGAVCRKLLSLFNVTIGSYVVSIGTVEAHIPEAIDFNELFPSAEKSPVRCPDEEAGKRMIEEIRNAREAGDTLGGVFECVALNIPPGLGSHVHWDRRLSARLIAAVGSIPAIKGVELGHAFENAALPGTKAHDRIVVDTAGALLRTSNRAAGVEGGISNGEPIVIRAAMKPISTTLQGTLSVDLATGSSVKTVYERSDICAVPRAAVVGEAMMAFVLAGAFLEKLGGDNVEEIVARFSRLPLAQIDDIPMNDTPWQFGYE
jgi:chorismate synthase